MKGLFKQPNGKCRIRWTDENGHRQSEVFDTKSDAQFALKRNKIHVAEIKRGLRELEAPKKTFNELCDYWLTYRSPQKRNQKDDESLIRAHLRPHFGNTLISSIKKSDIDAFKISKQHLSVKTVSNQLTLLISMLNAAIDEGWIKTYPKIKKPKVSIFSKDFSYLKTPEEVHRFLISALAEGELVHAMYATAIYTGMRQGEIAGLLKSDFDFQHRQITVQRSFSGPTKNELIRRIPIFDAYLPIIESWLSKTPGDLVFPNRNGGMFGESSRIFQEAFHRVLDRAQFPKCERHGRLRRYIVFHSLRHTFASHWMMNGGDLYKLRDLLGHQDVKMTQRYAHLAPHVFNSDLHRFNALSLTDTTNVIPFAKM